MYSKHKETTPIETLKRIKNILSNLDIYTAESWTTKTNIAFQPISSLHINLFGIGRYGSSGKGTSPEYALASAYGELIERLQTGLLLKNLTKYSPEDFVIAPDKQTLSINDFLNSKSNFLDNSLKILTHKSFINKEIKELTDNNDILNFWQSKVEKGKINTLACLPYYSLKEKTAVLLPQSIIRIAQSSNGMCAGNTPEEALVQGFSEVLERYSLVEISSKNLTPPLIPEKSYIKHKELEKIIKYYNNLNYEIDVRDCSLGKNYPVVSVAAINKETQKYKISFGAHPSLPIAIERCLTELSQYINLESNEEKQNSFSSLMLKEPDSRIKAINIRNGILLGRLKVKPEYFIGKPSWEYDKNTWKDEEKSNKTLLKKLINLCTQECSEIYVRDFSYLGFPAYQIVIPEMTPSPEDIDTYGFVRNIYTDSEIIEKYKTQAGKEEIFRALKLLKSSFDTITNCSLINRVPDILIKLDLSIKLKKYDEALVYTNEILNDAESLKELISIEEIKCLQLLIKLQKKDYNKSEIKKTLDIFQDKAVVEKAENLWLKENTLERLQEFCTAKNTSHVSNIDLENLNQAYSKIEKLKIKLKDQYIKNTPNQEKLSEIFDF